MSKLLYKGKTLNKLSNDADNITYDNTESELTATNIQDAIDELAENGGGNAKSKTFSTLAACIAWENSSEYDPEVECFIEEEAIADATNISYESSTVKAELDNCVRYSDDGEQTIEDDPNLTVSSLVNNLTSTSTDRPLTAKQGKVLNDSVTTLSNNLANLESDLDNFGSQQTLIGEVAQGGNVTVDTTKYNYICVIFTTNKDPFDFVTPAKVNRSTQWVSEIMGSNYTISVKINYVSGVFRWYETSTSSGASVTKCSVYGIK